MTAADIKALRTALFLTQYELSNLLGVTRYTIVRWEKEGGPTPHPNHMKRLNELAITLQLREPANA